MIKFTYKMHKAHNIYTCMFPAVDSMLTHFFCICEVYIYEEYIFQFYPFVGYIHKDGGSVTAHLCLQCNACISCSLFNSLMTQNQTLSSFGFLLFHLLQTMLLGIFFLLSNGVHFQELSSVWVQTWRCCIVRYVSFW